MQMSWELRVLKSTSAGVKLSEPHSLLTISPQLPQCAVKWPEAGAERGASAQERAAQGAVSEPKLTC